MPEVVTVANRKGGSGKTTTAVNVAVEWASRGARTLLIDLDSQGHAGIALGLTLWPDPTRTVHALFVGAPLSPLLVGRPTRIDNLSLLPADPLFDLGDAVNDPTVLRRALRDPLYSRYDWIVIDAPPARDVLLTAALIAAHGVLVPFLPHPLSLISLRHLARLFHDVATTYDHDLRHLWLLPVMVDPRLKLHRTILTQVESWFGAPAMLDGIHTSVKLAEAFGAGIPIQRHAPRSRAAEDYAHLATVIDQHFRGRRQGARAGRS